MHAPKRALALSLTLLWACLSHAWAGSPVVAAAADLKFALEQVAAGFKAQGGGEVRLVFGSSGNLYRQILQGAPFGLFLSADEGFAVQLADAGMTQDRGVLYGVGRIGILVPPGGPLKADAELKGLAQALANGHVQRFAIANPEHAPYGQRAEEALRHAGLWDAIKGRLVFGENVAQAAQFALSGSAQGGVVAYSLALSPALAKQGDFALIPADWHAPLRQRMVLLAGADEATRAFYDHLQGPAARAVMERFGFILPDAP
jgi:molybdate transport system substrate-binding protein